MNTYIYKYYYYVLFGVLVIVLNLLFIFTYIGTLPACMSVHKFLPDTCRGQRRISGTLGLEPQL